jgi:hypothetical protein
LAAGAGVQKFAPAAVKPAVQFGEESQSLRAEDLIEFRGHRRGDGERHSVGALHRR